MTKTIGRPAWASAFGALLATIGAGAAHGALVTLYAAPDGNDGLNGANTCTNPASACTLNHARNKARTYLTPTLADDVVVKLAGGTYQRCTGGSACTPFVLNNNDSGRNGHNVIYEAKTGETPVISGGVVLPPSAWSYDSVKNLYYAAVPGFAKFRQIYVYPSGPSGGELNLAEVRRGIRARHPNIGDSGTLGGYASGKEIKWSGPLQKATMEIEAADFSLLSTLATTASSGAEPAKSAAKARLNQVEAVWIPTFRHKRTRIELATTSGSTTALSFTAPEGLTYMADGTTLTPTYKLLTEPFINTGAGKKLYFYLENAMEFLDKPGEWYHDTSTTPPRLYYKPRGDENMSQAHIVVPQLDTMVQIVGQFGTQVDRIQFKGVTLAHSNWNTPSDYGYLVHQAALTLRTNGDSAIPGAMLVSFADNVRIENNTFRETGAHGLLLRNTLNNHATVNNVFTNLAAGGIVEYTNIRPNPQSAADNTVMSNSAYGLIQNNLVQNFGLDYTDAAGILVTQPHDMTIQNNTVEHGGYAGISLGWNWTTYDQNANNNVVNRNKISNVMKVHNDGGAIYSLGYMSGTLITYNWISNLTRFDTSNDMPIVGIYLDNGSTGKSAMNNVLDNVVNAFYVNTPSTYAPVNQCFNNSVSYNYHNATTAWWAQFTPLYGDNGNTAVGNTFVSGAMSGNTSAASIMSLAGRP